MCYNKNSNEIYNSILTDHIKCAIPDNLFYLMMLQLLPTDDKWNDADTKQLCVRLFDL